MLAPRIWLVAIVAVLATTASNATAQSPDAAKRDEARVHFEAGRLHHKVGRFAEAIEAYSKSYELVPLPGVLFNIAQCHRNLKDNERALFFFERFLQEAPEAPDADEVRKLIAELQDAIAKDEADAALVSPPPPPPPPPPIEIAPPPPPPPPIDDPSGGIHEQSWFWVLIGASAVAAAVAIFAIASSGPPDGTIGTIDARLRF